MTTPRVRPRSAIADAELARMATVDLPMAPFHLPHLQRTSKRPRAFIKAIASHVALAATRRPIQPDRVIVMNLVPVPVSARRR
jgi:hypothetical protein